MPRAARRQTSPVASRSGRLVRRAVRGGDGDGALGRRLDARPGRDRRAGALDQVGPQGAERVSLLLTVIILSAVVPTAIAQRVFQPSPAEVEAPRAVRE